jgi:hypothetical protein
MKPERITLQEFHARCKSQNVSAPKNVALICPVCGTIQSMVTLVKAGCAEDDVAKYIGFSCEGRFANAGSWPNASENSEKADRRRAIRGCDWTLGGLFQIHQLIIEDDGKEYARFALATPEQAQALEAANAQ